MSRKTVACLAVVAMAQVALASRTPVAGTSTYAHVWTDGNCYKTSPVTSVFSQMTTDSSSSLTAGQSYSAVNYTPGSGPRSVAQSFPSTDAGADAYSMAKLNVSTGELHLLDSGWINCGADSRTYGNSSATATVSITDVITLDQPAIVTISAHISGSTFGVATGGASTSAGIGAQFVFWQYAGGEMGWQGVGINRNYNPTFVTGTGGIVAGDGVTLPSPTPISENVSYSMLLPAGDTYFTASLSADFSLRADPGQAANVQMAFENTAQFQLLVPQGVTATSSYGIPIAVPEPTSLALLVVPGALALRRIRR